MRRGKIELYRDARREWRWRLRAPNGRIVADSGEGYRRRAAALRAIERVRRMFAGEVRIAQVAR
ncbi:MAG TPA: DUF1508 domain-containing protein [Phycisphaerales bacterium]|nr:DUF1508 domain-containing protein [Phycisphaerales bacterium]